MHYSTLATHLAVLWPTTYSDTLQSSAAKLPTIGGSYNVHMNKTRVQFSKQKEWAELRTTTC